MFKTSGVFSICSVVMLKCYYVLPIRRRISKLHCFLSLHCVVMLKTHLKIPKHGSQLCFPL